MKLSWWIAARSPAIFVFVFDDFFAEISSKPVFANFSSAAKRKVSFALVDIQASSVDNFVSVLADAFERTGKVDAHCVAAGVHGAFIDIDTFAIDRFISIFAGKIFASVGTDGVDAFLVVIAWGGGALVYVFRARSAFILVSKSFLLIFFIKCNNRKPFL